jgi:subtilisin family serine protease
MQLRLAFFLLLTSILFAIVFKTSGAMAAVPAQIKFQPDKVEFDSDPIVVAVIDTGLDVQALGSTAQLWRNPGETGYDAFGRAKESNSQDDDQNGYVDDLHGVDLTSPKSKLQVPRDLDGHGTHIAHLILKSADQVLRKPSSADQPPVPPRAVRLMVLKYYSDLAEGESNLKRSTEALKYAIENGAQIINFSGGGGAPDREERRVLESARRKGVLVVAAAGNEGVDTEIRAFFPASYNLNHVLPVAALGINEEIFRMSNFNRKQLMIAAPGEKILGPIPGGEAKMTGTSQATALTTGILAGLMAHSRLKRSPEVWIDLLFESSDLDFRLSSKMRVPAKINPDRAHLIAETLPTRDFLFLHKKGSPITKDR